jgi:hypothetical protein
MNTTLPQEPWSVNLTGGGETTTLRDAVGTVIAVFPSYAVAEYLLNLHNNIKTLKEKIEYIEDENMNLTVRVEDLENEINEKEK